MTINNILLNEKVYVDKSITANRIMKEFEEKRDSRKFGINLKNILDKEIVMDFNNDKYSVEKQKFLTIIHMPTTFEKSFLNKIFPTADSKQIGRIWLRYIRARDKMTMDVSKYFDGKKVFVKFSGINKRTKTADAAPNPKKNYAVVNMFLPAIDSNGVASYSQTLQHELTHVQDFIKSDFKMLKNENQKKKYPAKFENYYSNIYEFNRFINLLSNKKTRSKRIRDAMNAIKTPEQLKTFLRAETSSYTAEAFINNKELFQRLLKRLYREKLIGFETSSNLTEEHTYEGDGIKYLINARPDEIDNFMKEEGHNRDEVRFFADCNDKQMYIWDAREWTHNQFSYKIDKEFLYRLLNNGTGFSGTAIGRNGDWVMQGSDEILQYSHNFQNKNVFTKLLKDKWYDKYIHCSHYLKRMAMPFTSGKPSDKVKK